MIEFEDNQYRQIIKTLREIQKTIELSKIIRSDEIEQARYDCLASLLKRAWELKIPCKINYKCERCDIKKRNKCWLLICKYDKKKVLIKNIPYKRETLGNMNIKDLKILASHFKVSVFGKSKSWIVSHIIEYELGLVKQNRKKGGDII